MHRRNVLLVLVATVILVACSSSPQPAAPATTPAANTAPAPAVQTEAAPTPAQMADMATVFVYRPKAFMGMALRPTVMVDGKDLVNIGNGRVYAGHFKPGKYLFQMDDKKSGAELDLKPGDKVYFHVEIVPGFWKGGGRMTLMDPKQGEYEIKQLQPVPAAEIEDKSH